jgi:hypothetical protein
MGGISIDSALQVGFMLHTLLSRYQAVIQEFRVGHHSLTAATLQTVVKQCINFDKGPWLGPVSKDGKVPRSPSANAAGTNSGNGGNAYDALANKFQLPLCMMEGGHRREQGKMHVLSRHGKQHRSQDQGLSHPKEAGHEAG